MNLQQINKRIKSESWWSEESPGNFLYSFSAWRSFILQSSLYRKHLDIAFITYTDDFLYERTSERDKLTQFRDVVKKFSHDKQRILSHYRFFWIYYRKLIKEGEFIKENVSHLSAEKLGSIFNNIYNLYTKCFIFSVMPEAADIYTSYHLVPDLRKATRNKLKDDKLLAAAVILTSEPRLSFMETERLDFLKLVLDKKQNFTAFSKKYYWMQNNYGAAKVLKPLYFKTEAKRLLHKSERVGIKRELRGLQTKVLRQKRELKVLQHSLIIPKHLQVTLEFLRLMSKWIDDRKRMALHAVGYLEEICNEAHRRYGVRVEWLKYYTPEEFLDLLKYNKKINIKDLQQRRFFTQYVIEKKGNSYKETLYFGEKARSLARFLEPKKTNIIQGMVASAPLAQLSGIVQVVLNPHTEKFKEGRILVTSMTRPDFVPIMRKAKAIICDEGGITSHAAIISRELGISCIIGTKIATRVLKDGDKVEIDANHGVITILK